MIAGKFVREIQVSPDCISSTIRRPLTHQLALLELPAQQLGYALAGRLTRTVLSP